MPNTPEQDEIIKTVKDFRDNGISSTSLYDRMRKAEDFKVGKQWDEGVRQANQRKGKFCLTIPLIKPIIKQISGVEIENPRDIIVRPERNGTAVIAKILTAEASNINTKEMVRFELSQVFEAGLSTGQGVIGVFIDKQTDPKHANLIVNKLCEHDVLFDPACKVYKINDARSGCKFVIWDEWADKEYIQELYPDKKSELDATGAPSLMSTITGNVAGIINWLVGSTVGRVSSGFGTEKSDDYSLISKNRYQINHTWWRKPKRCVLFYDNTKSELDAKLVIKDEEIEAAKQIAANAAAVAKQYQNELASYHRIMEADTSNNVQAKSEIAKASIPMYEVKEVVVNVMHHTIRYGDIFLEDRVDELNGIDAFPLIPFWAYFDNGYKAGVAEDLIGTQEELNYIHSQGLNITKGVANSGFIIAGGVNTDSYKTFLQDHGGEDGVVLDKSKAGGSIEKIKPPQVPAAHITMEANAKENMRFISNQRTELNTQDSGQGVLSGKAIFLKQKASLQGSGSLFLNWNYTYAMFGNLVINILRHNDIFSHDEIMELVEKEELIDKDMFEQARDIVIQSIRKTGVELPQPPQMPNMLMLKTMSPREQMLIVANLKKEMNLYQQVQMQIDQQATEMARAMLFDALHDMRNKGEYSCTVTISPASETMKMARTEALFDLNSALIQNGDIPIDGEILIRSVDIDPQDKEAIIEKRRERLSQTSLAQSQVELNMAKAKQIEGKTPAMKKSPILTGTEG